MPDGLLDLKPGPDGSLSEQQIMDMLYDVRDEPKWRESAGVEEGIFDGNQLTQEVLEIQRRNGIPSIIVNLVAPVINSVAGFEATTRTDPIVIPEDEGSVEGAEALSADLKEIVRLTNFNRAYSQAFVDAAKIGIGWVEISRSADPFEYAYRVEHVPWREMYFDWRARKHDLSDARYMLRRKWYDRDILANMLPKHRKDIMEATSSWPAGIPGDWDTAELNILQPRGRGQDSQREYNSTNHYEWLDPDSRRVALHEVIYRVPHQVTVFKLPNGMVIEFDRENPHHMAAVASGQVQLQKGPTTKMRQALYVGVKRLLDRPIKGMMPHYVPVLCSQENGDGSPYGLIRHMKSPQEAYNARYSRVLYDLSARRAVVSDDAVEDHDRTAAELARPDAYIKLRTARSPNAVFDIQSNTDASPIVMQLMEVSRRDIQAVSGDVQSQPQGANQSGVALQQLQYQGAQTLGTFMDNYSHARQQGAQLLLQLRLDDLAAEEDVEVRLERTATRSARTVLLNRMTEEGARENDVLLLRTRVALAETPSTRTFRQQQAQLFAEFAKALPPELQVLMTDIFVELSDAPRKEEILDRIRAATGVGPEPEDPEEAAQLQAQEQAAAEEQAKQAELQNLIQEADARLKLANARLIEAKAVKLMEADTQLTEAKVLETLAKVDATEIDGTRVESDNALRRAKTAGEMARIGAIETDEERKDVELRRKLVETSGNLMAAARPQPPAGATGTPRNGA